MRARVVRLVLGTVLVATPAVLVASPGAATSDRSAPHRSSVILDWERTSFVTVYGPLDAPPPSRTPIPVGVLYLGFVSMAMHDAVMASSELEESSEPAAAASAAHDVLVEYYPTSAPELDAALEASLATVKDGPGEDRGVEVGAQVAADLIADRADDGRDDTSIVYNKPLEPGYWQPVGDPPVPMLAPWLGSVDPLVLHHLVPVDGPPALTSKEYARDYREVLELGSVDSAERTDSQTRTALFFNSNSAVMVGEAVIDMLEDEPLGLRRTARLFAVMHGAMADSAIKTWELKRDVGFWRPFQAIAGWDTDDNPATGPWTGPTAWAPLIPNPPYSDYTSGHAGLTAPAIQTLRLMLGEDTALTLHSYSLGTDRSYDDLSTIERQAFLARIWGGLHFRDAMQDGYAMGHKTAHRVRHALH